MNGSLHGTVTEFDDPRGLGVIADEDGNLYPFQCTRIADGTRTIAVGAAVSFEVAAGQMGRWEAVAITAVNAP